jgi:hypothetical protein
MSSFVWDNKFNSGIDSMDIQNRKIFDYMTTIYNELVDIRQKCDPFNSMFDQLELLDFIKLRSILFTLIF